GNRCIDRCDIHQVFCSIHRKYREDLGEQICNYITGDDKCIRHTYENSEFCRLHGGKPKKKEIKKRKLNSGGKSAIKDNKIASSEKFEVVGYEIIKFKETPTKIEVAYRKL